MKKTVTFLSLSLLVSTAAYGMKIGPKTKEETEKETQQLQQDSQKTEKPSWSLWDGLKNIGKNAPSKAVRYLKEGKLDLKDKTGKDYIWLEETILYCCMQRRMFRSQLITIYSILKKKNALPKKDFNTTVRKFLEEQVTQEKEILMANLIDRMGQLQDIIKPLLDEVDDTLEAGLKEIKKLDSAKNLTVEKGEERKKQDKLTDEKVYKEMGVTSSIVLLANIQEEVNNF